MLKPHLAINKDNVVTQALLKAGKALGLSNDTLGIVIGRDRSSLYRGIKADSKHGELALILIRCYRALYVLVGGNEQAMKHWFSTFNKHTSGIPAEQVQSVEGLLTVSRYLDAIRGKN